MKRILVFGDSWVNGGSLTSEMNKVYYDNRHKYKIPYDEKHDCQHITGDIPEGRLNKSGKYCDKYEFKYSWPGYLDRLLEPKRDGWADDRERLIKSEDWSEVERKVVKLYGGKIQKGVLNFGEGGMSNQQIINKVVKLLSSMFSDPVFQLRSLLWGPHHRQWPNLADNPDEVFVIVSWTSFYRSEMFNFAKDGKYTTFGIQSIYENHNGNFSNTELESFLDTVTNTPYIIEKYLQQCIYLHSFLKSIGVKHLFFNSFNETTDVIKSVHDHKLIGEVEFEREVFKNDHLTMLYKIIPEDIFYGGSLFGNSQLAFLLRQLDNYPVDEKEYKDVARPAGYSRLFLDDMHPSEQGNELWSNELYNTEQIQDFLK